MGSYYGFLTWISKPRAGVSEQRLERFPQPPRGTGTFTSHHHTSTNSPRGLLAKTATVLSGIEKEQVENAFCLCVGSKTRENIYLRDWEGF